ncbi:MAG: adenylyltransferase/cytidyltransferase family protein [Bacteroidetes bacterium]|nr:adenylyltransferase/cytidyltransferase family protein [Bacteroidota bacterium]MBS1670529.1 adenylyltransferase/cytidyltransferase family protein [Bacteroidota bacterium]
MKNKKIFVSGCFDLLHSGHVAFLNEAAQFGNLYVCIGSDETVYGLKGRYPVNNQDERKYMINALKCVHECIVGSGSGHLDFINELNEIKPDVFIVNEDGNSPSKKELCEIKNIEYKVLHRIPHAALPVRSTTSLRTVSTIPFRIDLAGGWLDQPYVSKYCSGAVITISIEPTIEFNNRSGMASSSRNKAIELWGTSLPKGNVLQNAKILFGFENPPGTEIVAGSQDALGIMLPALNYLYYENNYWPAHIKTINDDKILDWIEQHLFLIPLDPRESNYNVLENTNINAAGAEALAIAANECWQAINEMDVEKFSKAFTNSFHAQITMFPNMVDEEIQKIINQYKPLCKGYKLSGAGGGGYLILVNDTKVEDAFAIKIRRKFDL